MKMLIKYCFNSIKLNPIYWGINFAIIIIIAFARFGITYSFKWMTDTALWAFEGGKININIVIPVAFLFCMLCIGSNTANINNTLDDTISLSTKRLENITVATSNQIKTMAEEMEKLCVRKIEKLDNTLIEEFTDALSCLAGQLVTISEGFSEDYYRLLEELKEAFAQNDVVSTIDNEAISEGDK